ncbi:N-acetylglucosamine kinase [Ureibacillus composti]
MTERIILAIDGGATKTSLLLRSESGNVIFEKTSSGSNYQTIGAEKVVSILTDILFKAYQATNCSNIDCAVFAMAGIDTERDLITVKQIIETACSNVPFSINHLIVENDVLATLIGLTKGSPGALLISGTGSIAFATDGRDTFTRTGGWGHRAGDEGSGYFIGREILQTIFRTADGRNTKPTILTELVLKKLEIKSVEQLNSWLYQEQYTNAQTASISSVLPEAIVLEDELAINIAQNAAKELSLLALTTVRKLEIGNTPFTMHLNGGVFKHNTFILEEFKQYTVNAFPNISFTLCNENPIAYITNRALYALKT